MLFLAGFYKFYKKQFLFLYFDALFGILTSDLYAASFNFS